MSIYYKQIATGILKDLQDRGRFGRDSLDTDLKKDITSNMAGIIQSKMEPILGQAYMTVPQNIISLLETSATQFRFYEKNHRDKVARYENDITIMGISIRSFEIHGSNTRNNDIAVCETRITELQRLISDTLAKAEENAEHAIAIEVALAKARVLS